MGKNCPLCSADSKPYYQDSAAEYLHCTRCDLVFVPPLFHLSADEEKKRYDQHQNNPNDQRYRQFLAQLVTPVSKYIKPGSKGLDFGSGPGPTLSVMLTKYGCQMDLFDKFYANNLAVFNNKYDFICATEVVEHLNNPKFELQRLLEILKSGGVLALMTQMINEKVEFSSWYYKNDPTHICFFSKQTMRYLAKIYGTKLELYGDNVALFIKD
ncbi:MAG: class I SAM-dependent methyltransferase [Candidatus Thioglobus sp.]|nr:MAG: class I SAM-dependent methyltransferase [Candidatus Thioglobus sp.]